MLVSKVEAQQVDAVLELGKGAAFEQGVDPLPALKAVAVADAAADSGLTITANAVTTTAWAAGATGAGTIHALKAGAVA